MNLSEDDDEIHRDYTGEDGEQQYFLTYLILMSKRLWND